MTKSFLFLLFLFGIGYSVGPQFMQALKRDGLKPVLLASLLASRAWPLQSLLQKRCGWIQASRRGFVGCPVAERRDGNGHGRGQWTAPARSGPRTVVAHIAVADAVCYIFGYAGVILFCTVVAPALLRIDLRAEALKLEQALGMSRAKPGLASGWRKFELRAYRLPDGSRWPDLRSRMLRRACPSTGCSSTGSAETDASSRSIPA